VQEVASPAPAPKARKPAADDRQLSMPGVSAPVPPTNLPGRAASPFAQSPVLAARVPTAHRADIVRAVEFLIERQGVASAAAFATALQVLPFRVGGLVSKLQEALNLDGYEVLRYDPGSRQVHLDVGKLAQLFEVSL
jgi:hypothetical protein